MPEIKKPKFSNYVSGGNFISYFSLNNKNNNIKKKKIKNKAKKKINKCFSGTAASLSDPPHYPFLLLKIKKNTETPAFVLKPSQLSLFRSRFSEKRLRMQSAHDG